jgi:Rod binding domain-containing protein
MDSAKLILTEAVSPPSPLRDLGGTHGVDEAGKNQAAKDFESVLIGRVLDQMKNTIGDWGFEKDGVSRQVHGLFWLYLAGDIANNGGFGLWKDISRFFADTGQPNTTIDSTG